MLAAGYREVGAAGPRPGGPAWSPQAAAHGIVLLGPNCLGFLNAHARAAPFALTVPLPLRAGPVGIALQSGALASVVLAFARSRAIGVSTLATLGNESMISTADVVEYLVDDEQTRVICLFLEEISDPDQFARAAEKADRAGKPIVALKVGSSPVGQAGGAGAHRLGGRRRRGGRCGAPPAQRHPGDQHRGTARARARCSATTGGRAAAGWAC